MNLPPFQRLLDAHGADRHRFCVVLRYLGDLPYADIGVVLGCSQPAARPNVRAGLAALRAEVVR